MSILSETLLHLNASRDGQGKPPLSSTESLPDDATGDAVRSVRWLHLRTLVAQMFPDDPSPGVPSSLDLCLVFADSPLNELMGWQLNMFASIFDGSGDSLFYQMLPVEGQVGALGAGGIVEYEQWQIKAIHAFGVPKHGHSALALRLYALAAELLSCLLCNASADGLIDDDDLWSFVGWPAHMSDEDKMEAMIAHVRRPDVVAAAKATMEKLKCSHVHRRNTIPKTPDDCAFVFNERLQLAITFDGIFLPLCADDNARLLGVAQEMVEYFVGQRDSELESVLDDFSVVDDGPPPKRVRVTIEEDSDSEPDLCLECGYDTDDPECEQLGYICDTCGHDGRV